MNKEWVDPELSKDEFDPDAYQVLALDPGGTTGWCIMVIHPEAMSGDPDIRALDNVLWWTAGQFTGKQDNQIDSILELVNCWPNARLVTEDFKLRQLNAELDPVEINATLSWAVRPRYWIKQMPSIAMCTVTDDRQKLWGFWIPGQQHARDATKHAITFIKRQKERAVYSRRRGA